jgi:ABC-type branched-subunit amino acid transport system substrate-binding protein
MPPRIRFITRGISRWIPALVLLAALGVVAIPVSWSTASDYEARTAAGEAWRQQGFTVAVVWPQNDAPDFVEGVKLAWSQVDGGSGPFAGKIRLRQFTEPLTRDEGGVAARVASDGSVMVVLGHAVPEHIVPASLVYEHHSILFLTTQATDPRSTSHEFHYVFRLTPDDVQIADALVRFASSVGLKRIGVLYARTDHGESASRQFAAKAASQGIGLAFFRSYHATSADWRKQDFRPLVAEIQRETFDAVLVADELPRAAKLVRDLGEMGVTQPILATDKLDSPQLPRIAGAAANNVYVASPFDAASETPEFSTFHKAFEAKYGIAPSYAAAQGYEAFMLAMNAGMASGSAAPLVLATTIRLKPEWHGLFGNISFRHQGDVLGRQIAIKRMVDGEFHTVYSWKGTEE